MQRPETLTSDLLTGIRMVLFAGAARFDAHGDPERLARLRATKDMPGGDHYRRTGDPSMLMEEIQDAMGPGWQPTGEWAEKLESLRIE